jgi:hypothetical protein
MIKFVTSIIKHLQPEPPEQGLVQMSIRPEAPSL